LNWHEERKRKINLKDISSDIIVNLARVFAPALGMASFFSCLRRVVGREIDVRKRKGNEEAKRKKFALIFQSIELIMA
jgi:hypothetical protein